MDFGGHDRNVAFALTVGGASAAWFGAGALFLLLFGSMCTLNGPCIDSVNHYLTQILLVSAGGGMTGGGVYLWFSSAPVVPPSLRDGLRTAGVALAIIGGIASFGTYAFVHSILWGWSPGGVFEVVESFLFYPPPVLLFLGLVFLTVGSIEPREAPPGQRVPAVKIRAKSR